LRDEFRAFLAFNPVKLGVWGMLNRQKWSCCRWIPFFGNCSLSLPIVVGVLFLFSQAACIKKHKVPSVSAGPTRIALLPFDTPAENKDFRWTAMAGPILMAKASENAPDLVIIPLWQTMKTAIASAGASRSFDDDSAASAANWLGAKWSILGSIKPTKARASLMIEFIPGKSNQVPFRYIKTTNMDAFGLAFHEATRQFLRYTSAKPPELMKGNGLDPNSLKDLAQALDREYGWFEDADPGKAQEIVAGLARSDDRLARLLFDPALYPVLAQNK
jgi:hypothetical protein